MADTGDKSPTNTGEDFNQWSNPTNAFSSNNQYATENTASQAQDYYDFTFAVPADATIVGMVVSIEAKGAGIAGANNLGVELSWDGGTTYTTTAYATGAISTIDATYNLGGVEDTWGRSWSDSEFADATFRLKVNVINVKVEGSISLDHVQVKVFYTEAGEGTNTKINIGDAWKEVSAMKVNIGDAWKDVASAKINIGDTWKSIF